MEYGERVINPLPQGVKQLVERLLSKPTVEDVEYINHQILKVTRKAPHENLIIYVVDAYVLGEGDTFEIIRDNPTINTLLVLSLWNQYTYDAKKLGKENGVAVFTYSELMGAIYYYGNSYIDYIPPERD
ncbi:hypothetical protein [Bacillus sp. FJAT-45066]|uniref:hypothetical protein n=1 Tax=Bacillus sp. FJAT-45066 TaxID=2011010 RepID=UPI000BB93564|nr:hypothetical protein [Bacillus sp. FJAT-45066]